MFDGSGVHCCIQKSKENSLNRLELILYTWRKMANARDGKLYAGIVCFGSIVNTMWTFCYWFMLLSNQLSLHYLKYVLYYKPKRNGGIFTGARFSIQKKTRTTHISELVAKCFLTFRLNSLLTLISCIELCNLRLTQNVSQS